MGWRDSRHRLFFLPLFVKNKTEKLDKYTMDRFYEIYIKKWEFHSGLYGT